MLTRWHSLPVVFLFLLTGCAAEEDQASSPTSQPSDTPVKHSDTWIRTFEGPAYGAFFDVVLTRDGNLLATGATNHLHAPPYSGDALFMKLTLDGDVLWEKTWGGEGYEQAMALAPAGGGGYYVFGETDSYGAGDRDFFLLKITEDGAEEWRRTYGRLNRDWPYGMLKLENADLLLYGFSESETGKARNQYALRVNPEGDVLWEYIGEGSEEEIVIDALETEQGDLVLAVILGEDGGLLKLSPGGDILWAKRYELEGWQYASQAAPTDDGGYLLAGFSMSDGPKRQVDTWLARCTPEGELVWETTFGDPEYDDYANSMIRLKDGTYLLGALGNGMLISRVDEDGNLLWRRSLVGPSVYGAMALVELDQGGFIVAGLIQRVNGRSYDAILLRTDEDGLLEE